MAEKAGYQHFMLKEIFEQPRAVRETVLGRVVGRDRQGLPREMQHHDAGAARGRARRHPRLRHVVARRPGRQVPDRGAGARCPVEVDYGSEFRYRDPIVDADTLAIVITQSGETADTLAALREAKRRGARSIAICNVVGSMATREADGTVYTHAGPEIGVASTKAFTSQLVALHLLALAPRRRSAGHARRRTSRGCTSRR